MRVTHRMLQRVRDEIRETHAAVPSVREEALEARAEQWATPPAEEGTLAAGAARLAPQAVPAPGPAEGDDRLVRYLNDAWSVETALIDTLQKLTEESADGQVKALFADQRQAAAHQREELGRRLRELGHEPTGAGKGFFHRLVGAIWEGLPRHRDDMDRTAQGLMKGYAAGQFQAAMYHALDAYAAAAGDLITAELSRGLLRQEQEMADRVWDLITPTVAAAVPAAPAGA
jgi:ferritin-like metal-binding protein YciE